MNCSLAANLFEETKMNIKDKEREREREGGREGGREMLHNVPIKIPHQTYTC